MVAVLGCAILNTVALMFALPGSLAQSDRDRCDPWQYRDDNGDCVDRPHVHHHLHVHYEPDAGEQCWIECMCEEGTYPSGNDCGGCSFVGTVCIGN